MVIYFFNLIELEEENNKLILTHNRLLKKKFNLKLQVHINIFFFKCHAIVLEMILGKRKGDKSHN